MGMVIAPVRRWTLAGIIIAGLALALIGPGAAFAANTASFSSKTPHSGQHLTTTRPTISVIIYDRYGLHGSGAYSMKLDGHTVRASATYLVKGSWNPSHPDYRRIRLTYRVPHSLSAKSHKVTVKTHDRRHRNSSKSWSFEIKAPARIYPPSLSSPSPAKGSSSTATRPTITLSATDRYGIAGAGSSTMSLDGVPVTCAILYTKSGVSTSFRISYSVPSNLAPGSHTALVAVTNIKGAESSYAWSFTVVEPPLEAMPVSGTACTDCHAGYPTTHPMANCEPCHGAGAPARANGDPMTPYTPGDLSAHTISCALEAPCHGGDGSFPHVLDADCTRCHAIERPGIPPLHSLAVEDYHQSDSRFCIRSGCHVASLTLEHYRRTVDGERLSCGTCHGSTDPAVFAAISTGSTACESCHDLTGGHPGTVAAHTATASCVRSGCHSPDVAATHGGNCAACHAVGKTPSAQCTTCHSAPSYHAGEAAAHALPAGGCVGSACHGTDAELVHKSDCSRCHTGSGTPVLTCSSCHDADTLALHPNAAVAHTADAISCTTADCHGSDIVATHAESAGGLGCITCHRTGKTPSKTCADCHAADIVVVHSAAASSHAATGATCISSDCHANADVASIHDKASGGPGCGACHDPGTTPTLVCATSGCHPGELEVVHAIAGVSHTSVIATCVSASCHKADVTLIHKNSDLGCRSCHRSGRQLTAACPTCHPGDTVDLHSRAAASHAAPAGTCVTSCHPSDVSGIHGQTDSTCAACHAQDKTPSTVCADCHDGTVQAQHASAAPYHTAPASGCVLPACHVADVTTLHLGAGGLGCSRCHSPGQIPTLDCASCHGTDLLTVHASANASHALPEGSSCGGAVCHESNVASIHRMSGKNCAACHRADGTPTVDCSACHTTDLIVVHQAADAAHAVAPNGSCSTPTCHSSGNAATIHQPSRLSCTACHSASVTTKTIVCAECHSASTIPAVHGRFASSHAAPTGSCVKSECHGTDVLRLHASGPGCAVCHGKDAPTTLDCATSGCHSTDINVVHASAAVSHVAHAGYCVRSGCHVGDLTTIHDFGGKGIGCAACHAPDRVASDTCTNCHPATQTLVHASADASHTTEQTTCSGYATGSPCHRSRVDIVHRTTTSGCRACHTQDATLTLSCNSCHVGTTAPTHSSAESSHTAPAGLCVNGQCHGTDVAAEHADSTKSCLACHASDVTPSLTCAGCHTEDVFVKHPQAATLHKVRAGTTCFAAGCHTGTDVSTVHGAAGGPGCTACHDKDKVATTDCSVAACHGADFAVTHERGNASHGVTSTSCVRAGCHVTDAVQIHAGGQNCASCHSNPDHAPSLVCADCHAGDDVTVHDSYVGTRHDPVAGACTSADCHSIGISATHTQAPGFFTPEGGPSCTPCHTTGPLTNACSSCHTGAQAPTHAAATPLHVSSTTTCVKSGCHRSDAVWAHTSEVTHTDGSAVPSCAACHGNPNHTATTDCTVCHFTSFTTEHPAPAAKHTASLATCVKSGCHVTDVTAIHTTPTTNHPTPIGCAACHSNPDHAPSLDCAICHFSTLALHPAPAAKHTADSGSCVKADCHVANVTEIHSKVTASHPTPIGCAACHGNPDHAPTLACATCHFSDFTTQHPAPVEKHTSNTAQCIACHVPNVAIVHSVRPSKCSACHNGGALSTTCTNCHAVGGYHSGMSTAHQNAYSAYDCHCRPQNLPAQHSACTTCHYQGGTLGCENCHH